MWWTWRLVIDGVVIVTPVIKMAIVMLMLSYSGIAVKLTVLR